MEESRRKKSMEQGRLGIMKSRDMAAGMKKP